MIIKRDGTIVSFDSSKIRVAIKKAMQDTTLGVDFDIIDIIEAHLVQIYEKNKDDHITVEEIQDAIEDQLVKNGRLDVAKTYIKYRYQRQLAREQRLTLDEKLRSILTCQNIENSNANVDERSASGREKTATEAITKEYALNNLIHKDVAQAHRDGLVYIHDLSAYAIGTHNCLNADVGKLLGNGFRTKNGDVRPANSFSTACQLIAVIFQLQSQNQFGGVGSNMIDYQLALYVKKSFAKHLSKGIKWLEDDIAPILESVSLTDQTLKKKYPKAFAYALEMMEAEGKQSAQALYHNLNTLESRSGSQLPFTSINYGTDTSREGQKVSEWLIKASIDGIGKHNVTAIFPIAIFKYKKGVNDVPGTPNYYLRELAGESLSRRIYPKQIGA